MGEGTLPDHRLDALRMSHGRHKHVAMTTSAEDHFIRLEGKTKASIARTLLEHKEQRAHMGALQCHAQDTTTLKHDLAEGNLVVTIGSLGVCTKRLSLHPVRTFLSRPPESFKSSEVRIGDCALHMRQEKYFRFVLRRATAP